MSILAAMLFIVGASSRPILVGNVERASGGRPVRGG